ncbi:MAG: ROK family protein [Anaerolineae bacterium]
MSDFVVGIDLGGTRMRAALFDPELNLIERQEVPTNARRGRDTTLDRMRELVQQILPDDPQAQLGGIGISAPGPVNPQAGLLVAPPNLPGWHNVPLVQILQKEFGYSTFLGNDANVAALAETARGAARGYRHVIFITLSTGIGGGIISDGRLLLGKDGLAAEVGHMPLVVGDTVTTLEKEAAGPALARKARARIEAGEKSIISEMVKGKLEDCTGGTVGKAAVQGDALALSVVQRAGFIVGGADQPAARLQPGDHRAGRRRRQSGRATVRAHAQDHPKILHRPGVLAGFADQARRTGRKCQPRRGGGAGDHARRHGRCRGAGVPTSWTKRNRTMAGKSYELQIDARCGACYNDAMLCCSIFAASASAIFCWKSRGRSWLSTGVEQGIPS